MLHLTKIQIASIAVASVLASYVAAGSLAPQNTSIEPQNLSLEQALLEVQYADAAAVDYFLKIDGIEGESTDSKHDKWIEIESFSWGMSQTGTHATGGAGVAGKVNVQDISITKLLDKSSPVIMQACADGKHFSTAEIAVRKAGGDQQDYFTIKMENAFISSYSIGGSSGEVPTDSLSLNFTKMTMTYKPQKPDGTLGEPVIGSFDLSKKK